MAENEEESEESDELGSYRDEEKDFNMTASQMSEYSEKFLWGDF